MTPIFQCLRIPGNLKLTESSCASQYKAAQTSQWAERLPHCVSCPVGAAHAGMEVSAPFAKRMICVRCGSGATRLVHGVHCMSCYNREREWHKGVNAKGSFPTHFKSLRKFALLCCRTGRRYTIEASCMVEARLAAQKRWGLLNVQIDARVSPLARQLDLFEGVVHAASVAGR